MWANKIVAVVVPAWNEERLIGRTLGRVPAFVDTVLVIDDGSTDGTRTRAQQVRDSRIRLVSHGENRGVGAAIATGFQRAFSSGAEVAAVMAGDDQMDPSDLISVIEPILADRAEFVKGNRFLHGARRDMPFIRRTAGLGLSAVTRFATGLPIDDSQCGYVALSARAAAELPLSELWPRYGYPNDLLGLLAAHRMRVLEVPVKPIYADERSGVRPWHAVVVLGVIARRWLLTRARTKSASYRASSAAK